MRFFWQFPARVVRLEQQVFLLTVQVKELKNDSKYLMDQVQEREKELAAVEESVRRAASQTTVAVLDLYTEISLFRRGLGDWVRQVGSEEEDNNEGSES